MSKFGIVFERSPDFEAFARHDKSKIIIELQKRDAGSEMASDFISSAALLGKNNVS